MQRVHISSSNLRSVGYDDQNMILEIEFKDGSIYQYFSVPKYVYEDLFTEPSAGKYAYKNIYHSFRYERIGEKTRHQEVKPPKVEVLHEFTGADLRSVYASLAKIYHPDSGYHNDEMFKKINKLYREGDYWKLKSLQEAA